MSKPPTDPAAPDDDEPKPVEIEIVDIGESHTKIEPPIDTEILGWMIDEAARRQTN